MKGIGLRMGVRVVRSRSEESKGWGDFISVLTWGCRLDYSMYRSGIFEYCSLGLIDRELHWGICRSDFLLGPLRVVGIILTAIKTPLQ